MERIKRFFWDDAATAEAASTVVLIAAVGIGLAIGVSAWYQGLFDTFTTAGTNANTLMSGSFTAPTAPQ